MGDMREEFDALKEVLRQEREVKEKSRYHYAIDKIKNLGFSVCEIDKTRFDFYFNGKNVMFYPYTG